MDEKDKKPEAPKEEAIISQDAPADALSRSPDELEEERAKQEAEQPKLAEDSGAKKESGLKKLYRKVNIYFLFFILVIAVAAVITVVNYLNSQKAPPVPTLATQELTEEQLKDLATTDASVGDVSQTLTIKGNAVIDGQTLMRGNLNIAGNLQTGGSIQGPAITISGTANLGQAQINSLQVASDVAIQGNFSGQSISIAGTSTFNGPMTASRITVSELVMSGSGSLNIPNHIHFTGPAPGRSVNQAQLGTGGSASVSGSDAAGVVNITTGNSPAAGCMVRINFVQRYTTRPSVIVSPVGYGAGLTTYYTERDQDGFSICSSNPAPGNQSFGFDYFVMG